MSPEAVILWGLGTLSTLVFTWLAIKEMTGGNKAEAAVWLKCVISTVILTVALWLAIRMDLWLAIPVGGGLICLICHKRKGKSNPPSKGGEGWIQKILAWPLNAIKWLAVEALWSLAIGAVIAFVLEYLGLASFQWSFALLVGVGVRVVFKILKTVKAVAIAIAIGAIILMALG